MTNFLQKQDQKFPTLPGEELAKRSGVCVRLASDLVEVEAAQRLRYHIFHDELKATPSPENTLSRRDVDEFDSFCDHLLVVAPPGSEVDTLAATSKAPPLFVKGGRLVATCRLLTDHRAKQKGGFYTQDEFAITDLIARKPTLRYLELGRSCVLEVCRTTFIVDLLWRGIWRYARLNHIDVLFGCASLYGTDPEHFSQELSLLAADFKAPLEWQVTALPHRRIEMTRVQEALLDRKKAMRALPPLVRGYLRLGCFIGEGAVLDPLFKTIDVLILMPMAEVTPRYKNYLDKTTNSFDLS